MWAPVNARLDKSHCPGRQHGKVAAQMQNDLLSTYCMLGMVLEGGNSKLKEANIGPASMEWLFHSASLCLRCVPGP